MPDSHETRRLAIVWHSRTGASEALAREAAEGAGDQAVLLRAELTGPDDLLQCAGYLFVCPENLGSMSGAMKEMFDRCYYGLLGRIEGCSYATCIAAGSAGQGAQQQIDRIVTGWRLRRVAESLIVNLNADTPDRIMARKTVPKLDRQRAHDLGSALAIGLRLGIY